MLTLWFPFQNYYGLRKTDKINNDKQYKVTFVERGGKKLDISPE